MTRLLQFLLISAGLGIGLQPVYSRVIYSFSGNSLQATSRTSPGIDSSAIQFFHFQQTGFSSQQPSVGYSGASGGAHFFSSQPLNDEEQPPYAQFVLPPENGESVVWINRLAFGARTLVDPVVAGGTGPSGYEIRTSLDEYGAVIASGALNTSQGSSNYWHRYSHDDLDLLGEPGEPITVRISFTGAQAGSRPGTFRIDDVVVDVMAVTADREPWIRYFGFDSRDLGLGFHGRPRIGTTSYGWFDIAKWPYVWSGDLERFLYLAEISGNDREMVYAYDWESSGWVYTDSRMYPWYYIIHSGQWHRWPIQPLQLYVAPFGDDSWTGQLSDPNTNESDGPLATIQRARDMVREMRGARSTEVLIRGGEYFIDEPLYFRPEDSGTALAPITYRAFPGEFPIISGGRRIEEFSEVEPGLFGAHVAEATHSNRRFRQLFVNDRRMTLARTPNNGYFRFAGPADPEVHPPATPQEKQYYDAHFFRYHTGQMRAWENIQDVNIVAFFSWHTGILPLKWVNESSRTFNTFAGMRNTFAGRVGEQMRYFVENSPDCLDSPGEWRIDRQSGWLDWISMGDGEPVSSVIAPFAERLLVLEGSPQEDRWVQHLHFEGLSFRHSEFPLSTSGYSDTQAALGVSAAIELLGARQVRFVDNEITQVGNHAVWIRDGSHRIRIERNHLHDLGGGGIYIGNRDAPLQPGGQYQRPDHPVGHNVVENNYIHDVGLIFKQSHGLWIGQSSDNVIRHNEISHTFYTPVALGWSWSFEPTDSNRNLVEYNYIHNGMQNILADSGGIYTLGWQEDTVIRGNVIHDIWGYREHQGHGIYPDEGSRGIRYTGNLVFRTSGSAVGINYGQDLRFDNNVFASNASGAAIRRGVNAGSAGARLTFDRNIFYLDRERVFSGDGDFLQLDRNLYSLVDSTDSPRFPEGASLGVWTRRTGWDSGSVVADPAFLDPFSGDFRIGEGSPALGLGVESLDLDKVGLQGPYQWTRLPLEMAERRNRPRLPAFAHPWPNLRNADNSIEDGFEAGDHIFAGRLEPADQPGPSAPNLRFFLEGPEGATVRLERISFGARSLMPTAITGASGPSRYAVRTSADGFTHNVAGGQLMADKGEDNYWYYYDRSIPHFIGAVGNPLEVRIYFLGANGESYPGTFRIDDVTLMASTSGSVNDTELPAILTYRFENGSMGPTPTTGSLVPVAPIRDDIAASELSMVNFSITGLSRDQPSRGYTGASGMVLISHAVDDVMFLPRSRTGNVTVTSELVRTGQSSLRMESNSATPAVFTYNSLPGALDPLLDGGAGETVFHLYYLSGQSNLTVRYQDPERRIGPLIVLHGNTGILFGNGRELMTIPPETWIRVQIDAGVGAWNTGLWHLAVERMDTMERRDFSDLPMWDGQFGEWQRLLWRADAAGTGPQAIFYFDDVHIRPDPNP